MGQSNRSNFIIFMLVLYLLFMLAATITNLVISILYYLDINLGSELYQYPIKNWQTDIVIDFDVGINCKGDNIFHYVWPGTVGGCHCVGGGSRRGPCCVNRKNHRCSLIGSDCRGTGIPGVSEKYGEVWEIEETSIRICAQRVPGYSFSNRNPGDGLNCHEIGDLKCGQGEYAFCVPQKYGQCPIRRIAIAEINDATTALQGSFEEKIKITNTKYLFISRSSSSSYPIAEFRVQQGSSMCLKNSQSVGSPGRTPYFLLDYDTDPGCYADQRFIRTSELGEQRLFHINNIDDIIIQLPQTYEVDDKYQYHSFFNNFGKLRTECRGYLSDINNNSKTLQDISALSYGILILSCLTLAHFLLFDFWSGLLQGLETMDKWDSIYGNIIIVSSWSSLTGSGDNVTQDCCYRFLVVLQYCLIISFFGVITSQKQQIRIEQEFLEDLRQKNCSDEYFDEIIKQVQASISTNYPNVIFWLVLFTIILDPNLFYIIRKIIRIAFNIQPPQKAETQCQVSDSHNSTNTASLNMNIQEQKSISYYNQSQNNSANNLDLNNQKTINKNVQDDFELIGVASPGSNVATVNLRSNTSGQVHHNYDHHNFHPPPNHQPSFQSPHVPVPVHVPAPHPLPYHSPSPHIHPTTDYTNNNHSNSFVPKYG